MLQITSVEVPDNPYTSCSCFEAPASPSFSLPASPRYESLQRVVPRVYLPVDALVKRALNHSTVNPVFVNPGPVAKPASFIQPSKSLAKSAMKMRITVPKKPVVAPAVVTLDPYVRFAAYDQGGLGSCTANAFCAAFRILAAVSGKFAGFQPSRLFFYYNERVVEGTVAEDAGADIIDGENYVVKNGICKESSWPYIESRFSAKPPVGCYKEALNYRIKSFTVLPQAGPALVAAMKLQLAAKVPLLIAVAVYDSFESSAVAASGVVPMPMPMGETLQGGHEMCVVGYNDARKAFLVLNSWGPRWGIQGKCYIPYAYFLSPDLCYEVSCIAL